MAFCVACIVGLTLSFPDRSPDDTAKSLHGPPGFEFTVFASEPMVVNPTNMEVDSRGRVWVTEGLNYRFFANKDFKRVPGADKIKILEDTDGDGKADKVTVFAENIYPVPMGLAIQEIWKDGKYVGCRVFTGNSPDLLVFEDTNGDDKADKREVLLTGFGGHDSDHGVHGMFLGPDGLLYFTQGDGKYGGGGGPQLPRGATMKVVGKDGRTVENYRDGTVLRCNLDGTGLELLATGLRNNYEVAVDSFGRIFCSDNDDDGNHGCRMCWILPGAHYGYHTPGSPRHWGEENPANAPKLVGTGNGSPCGIMVYEGELLPPECRGSVLQVDAGTRQINLHPLTKVGASLRTEYKVLVKGDDPQFRPVDCCTAPDGSLMIADWYDAGVGGHRFTDQKTGRIYRLAPKYFNYLKPKIDRGSPKGLVEAIGSPNVTTSFAAGQALRKSFQRNPAIAFDEGYGQALKAANRMTAVRVFQGMLSRAEVSGTTVSGKAVDPDKLEIVFRRCQREMALAKAEYDLPRIFTSDAYQTLVREKGGSLEALPLFRRQSKVSPGLVDLVFAWDGSDRFYLQAIRIGCSSLSSEAKSELFDHLMQAALIDNKNENFALPPYYPTGSNEAFPLPSDPVLPADARGKLIGVAWVLESIEALPALERLMSERPSENVNRGVMMALSRFRDPKAADAVFNVLKGKGDPFQKAAMLQLLGGRIRKEWKSLLEDARTQAVYKSSLEDADLRLTAVRTLPAEFLKNRNAGFNNRLVQFVTDARNDMAVREAAFTVLLRERDPMASSLLDKELKDSLATGRASPLAMIGVAAMLDKNRSMADTNKLLMIIRDTKFPAELRRRAVQTMAADTLAAKDLLRVHKIKALPTDVLEEMRYFLNNHADAKVRAEAAKVLPIPKAAGRTMDVRALVTAKGDPEKGRSVFFAEGPQACGKCHRVQGIGQWVGPDLSAIGEKYPKSELFYHMVQPSGAVAFGYQNWSVELKDGRVLNGLIVEETPERIVLRTATGDRTAIATSEIESRKALPTSLMPDKLADPLKDEQIVDLLEFLSSLRQPVVEAAEYQVLDGGAPSRKLVAGKDGVLDFSSVLKSQKDAPGVVVSLNAESPIAQQVELVLSTAIPTRVVVNGAEVATSPGRNGGLIAKIDLKQGPNDVLLKLSSGTERPTLTTAFVAKRPVRLGTKQ
jgi:putative membrane-bound dehydrogenase-like protein